MESTGRQSLRRTPRTHCPVLALLFIAGFALACGHGASPVEPAHPEPSTGPRTLVLAVGQSAAVGQSSQVTFERVTGDSRCPTGVTCAWAGEVTLAMSLHNNSGSEAFTLSDRARSAAVQRFLFELVSVEPYPAAESRIDEADYRASIRVSQQPF